MVQQLNVEQPASAAAQVRDALEELENAAPSQELTTTRVGIVLRGVRDWVVGQRKLTSGSRSSKGATWRVIEPGGPASDDADDDADKTGR